MFYENFVKICKNRGEYPTNVVSNLGLANSSQTKWKKGAIPSVATIRKIADYLHVTVSELLEESEENIENSYTQKKKNVLRVPVYGNVAAGVPIEAIEDIEDYEELDADKYPKGEYMALRISGDSMEPVIQRGDIVIIYRQDYAEEGDTAIVLVNGCDATCKRIKKTPDGIKLVSINPTYKPMSFTRQQIEDLPVIILGKVIELRRKVF